jgi:hypothetical protein
MNLGIRILAERKIINLTQFSVYRKLEIYLPVTKAVE